MVLIGLQDVHSLFLHMPACSFSVFNFQQLLFCLTSIVVKPWLLNPHCWNKKLILLNILSYLGFLLLV